MPATLTDPTRSAHALLNLGAAARNLRQLRTVVPHARIMAVIKANAYGHGLLRMARGLSEADAFAVARTDEGLLLRTSGSTQRIAILQGFASREELQAHAAAGLEPIVHSDWQVELLETTPLAAPLRIWLKIDTGMHRLGMLPNEFDALLTRLRACPAIIQPIPIMSHLANADALEDDFTEQQLRLFRAATQSRASETSIANSAGLLAWQEARKEWVRPGISLFGVSPFPHRTGQDEHLEPVMTFRTRLISIKTVEAGARVGYGGDWICPHATRLGVAAVGYGDGYPRLAPSGTPVLIRGQRVSLVGRVSMDMITVDLTACPAAQIGDLVTLWGEGLPVEIIASQAGTIPYDLLCGVTRRVKFIESSP
jgi:alanine racemase